MDITCVSENNYKIKSKRGSVNLTVGGPLEIVGGSSKQAFVINQPGEYEVEGISVFAYPAGESLAALIQVEDIKTLALASPITDAIIDELDTVDAIILGTRETPSKVLVEMVGKIEPSYVIPAGSSDKIAVFIKDFEHSSRDADKLSLSKATMATDITDVVVLHT